MKINIIKFQINECNQFMQTLTGHILESKDVLNWFEVSTNYKITKYL